MNTSTANQAAKINRIVFDTDELNLIQQNEDFFVPLKPICAALNLDWESNRQLIERDTVLSSVACPIQATGTDNKQYKMFCLPLSYLNGWLFKLNPSRYEGDRRDKIIRYQKECYQVLYRHFFPHTHKQSDRLKNEFKANRLEINFRKSVFALKEQAEKEADRIFKGGGTIRDLDDCPQLQAKTLEILEKMNQESLFPEHTTESGTTQSPR
jgi:hypothetical protein